MTILSDKKWAALCSLFSDFLNKGMRQGQSYMCALCEVDNELYKEITGSDADCFYDDTKIKDFMNYLMDRS